MVEESAPVASVREESSSRTAKNVFPGSVEEAAALLGAALQVGDEPTMAVLPPQGMHPAFSILAKPSCVHQLIHRLHVLRALLRTEAEQKKLRKQHALPAAPSILQVLKKLLTLSSSLAAAASTAAAAAGNMSSETAVGVKVTKLQQQQQQQAAATPKRLLVLKHRYETPPLLSTPCRILWVDCVVLVLGFLGSTEITQFLRQMLGLASLHPRSAKSAGGVRIAALAVVAGLLLECDNKTKQEGKDDDEHAYQMATILAPWSLDVLQVALKALKSAGAGEPTFREYALRAASGAVAACRTAAIQNRRRRTRSISAAENLAWLFPGAMEDRSMIECVKILRQATTDKFPEIRKAAATLAAVAAPLLVAGIPSTTSPNSATAIDPLQHLEEVIGLALKNLDDESAAVAMSWAEALARCLCTSIQYHHHKNQEQQQQTGEREDTASNDAGTNASSTTPRFGGSISTGSTVVGGRNKPGGWVHAITNMRRAVQFTAEQFVKAGGDLAAARLGGTFSIGGRAVRIGYANVLIQFLRLQYHHEKDISNLGSILSLSECIAIILTMVDSEVDKQSRPSSADANLPIFGGSSVGLSRTWSKADSDVARVCAGQVLRRGLSELAAEHVQLSILQELLSLLPQSGVNNEEMDSPESNKTLPTKNSQQIQVILIELSHLISALGEAATSKVEDITSRLKTCLSHEDLTVRHETAISCLAFAGSFPADARTLARICLFETQDSHRELVAAVTTDFNKVNDQGMHGASGSGLRMFRRSTKETKSEKDSSLPFQFAIHGRTLMVSLVLKEMVQLPGGLPIELLEATMSVAEILISFQCNEALTASNPSAVCACLRAGFCLLSGMMSAGPEGVSSQMPLVVGAWRKTIQASKGDGRHFSLHHDLVCVDAVLSSLVTFLQFCSELLLVIPDTLGQVTMLLEEIFPMLQPKGRFGNMGSTSPLVAARLESATAALLECFAWLPSGSFPMVADNVFSFSETLIQKACEEHIGCSILYSLVTKEDSILDSKTFSRAQRVGQVGGAMEIEESIIALNAEATFHSERENVIHLRSDEVRRFLDEKSSNAFRDSSILDNFVSDNFHEKAPTPLHEVGTWRRPFDPSCSSKIRVVDAAVQAFSATFGLKDGKEQQGAMNILESLIPPLHAQLARTIGINATATDQDRRTKGKEDNAAVSNIIAVLLSCLQSLPLHEATHNVPIGLGPPWMNKAKDLLLTLLPSSSTIIRRAASEGLALLATLGVTEDAHFLQSSLLHSLDEVMHGNKPDGKPRSIALESVSAARAGSLLTLAFIQRTAYNVARRKRARARGRAGGGKASAFVDESNENLPVLQMMTRIIPSAACHGFKDYFAVKTYALYSFSVLLAYSLRLETQPLGIEDQQLLLKAVELVEDNFSGSWASVSSDFDRGQESEKMTTEIAFLAVLLRLMTYLIPFLHVVASKDCDVARRFSIMSTVVLESHGSHPTIFVESMAFFEVMATHSALLPFPARSVLFSENPIYSCIPYVLAALTPSRPTTYSLVSWRPYSIELSEKSQRSAVFMLHIFSKAGICIAEWTDMKIVSRLFASLETVCGARRFLGSNLFRSIAPRREANNFFTDGAALEAEIFHALPTLLFENSFCLLNDDKLIRWILLAQQVLSPSARESNEHNSYTQADVISAAITRAISDVDPLRTLSGQSRWQVKCLAAQLATEALFALMKSERLFYSNLSESPQFNFATATKICAEECLLASQKQGKLPPSKLAFHLESLLSSACMSSVATSDRSELYILQENSVRFLQNLLEAFGPTPDPENPKVGILDQHATAIFSTIKHALSALDDDLCAGSCRLFVAGCKALVTLLENDVTSDPMVLKRLLRSTIPAKNSVPVFDLQKGLPPECRPTKARKSDGDTRSVPITHICKIWMTIELLLGDVDEKSPLKDVAHDLVEDDVGIAIHAAAIAFDGCCLLSSANLSFAGKPRKAVSDGSCRQKGFYFQDAATIDDSVRELLASSWSSCGRYGLSALLRVVSRENIDPVTKDYCCTWILSLSNLLILGSFDGVESMKDMEARDSVIAWAQAIQETIILRNCMSGLGALSCSSMELLNPEFYDRMNCLTFLLLEVILIPVIRHERNREIFDIDSVAAICEMLTQLAASPNAALTEKDFPLAALLRLLHERDHKIILDGHTEIIFSSSLLGICSIIQRMESPTILVRAMVQLVLEDFVVRKIPTSPKLRDASTILLVECLKQDVLLPIEKQQIGYSLASNGLWDCWVASFAALGENIAKSLEYIRDVLQHENDFGSLANILAALRSVVQNSGTNVSGMILSHAGAEIFKLLYECGTARIPNERSRNCIEFCADCMKVILAGYQNLVTDSNSDETIANFISGLFGVLLEIVRFNGLPNYASPEPANDPALGRLCAQAILHIARTSPSSFKSCLGTLSEQERTLTELTVRAEMGGYTKMEDAQRTQTKKLALKNFKK
jgi:hypothetical protein